MRYIVLIVWDKWGGTVEMRNYALHLKVGGGPPYPTTDIIKFVWRGPL